MDGGRPFIVEVIVFDVSVDFSAGLSFRQLLSLELNEQIFFFYRQLLAMTTHNFMTTVLSKNVPKVASVPSAALWTLCCRSARDKEGGREREGEVWWASFGIVNNAQHWST